MSARELITENLDLWTGAVTQRRSAGRGSNGKIELTGINKLRELILELAVRGKLVDQEPSDEPASVLLERIADEKARLVKEGKIKKPKKLPEITEEEPIDLPKGWQVTYIGEFITLTSGQHLKGEEYSETPDQYSIPYLTGPAEFGRINPTPTRYTKERRALARPGDILITCKGSGVGKLNWADEEIAISRQLMAASSIIVDKRYTFFILDSLHESIREKIVGIAIPGISREDINHAITWLPPLSEQHRIVEKVDELMALCDRLEQQVGDQLEAHDVLVDTLLEALTRSADAAEVAKSWARIAEHFDTLFTTEASIDKLKQAILQLAVMGRLVEQDPNDEPASVLLERIADEKARLVNEGKIKKPKSIPVPRAEEIPFKVPERWKWCRLKNLSLHSESGWSPQCRNTPRSGVEWGVLKVSAVSWGTFNPGENKALPTSLTPRIELEVRPNDFLISRANTAELVARSVVVQDGAPKHLMMSDKIVRFVFSGQVCVPYINLINNSKVSRDYYFRIAGGTSSSMKNVSRKQVQELLVPLPPKKEQHRIVEKIDELMDLCDQLKTRLAEVGETKVHLAEAVVKASLS